MSGIQAREGKTLSLLRSTLFESLLYFFYKVGSKVAVVNVDEEGSLGEKILLSDSRIHWRGSIPKSLRRVLFNPRKCVTLLAGGFKN